MEHPATGRDDRHMSPSSPRAPAAKPCAVLNYATPRHLHRNNCGGASIHFYVEHAEIIPASDGCAAARRCGAASASRPTCRSNGRIAGQPGARPLRWRNWQRRWKRRSASAFGAGLRRQRLGARAPGGAGAFWLPWQALCGGVSLARWRLFRDGGGNVNTSPS
ncbi:MAG: hypothetical protein R2838_12915 [Caldilineaceae bacterium]